METVEEDLEQKLHQVRHQPAKVHITKQTGNRPSANIENFSKKKKLKDQEMDHGKTGIT